jgi:hypothetical protein
MDTNNSDVLVIKIGKVGVRANYNDFKNGYMIGPLLNRIKELQTANPFKLSYIKALRVTGNVDWAEKVVHEKLKSSDRINKLLGEWYEIKTEDLNWLCSYIKDIASINGYKSFYIEPGEIDERETHIVQMRKKDLITKRSVRQFFKKNGYYPKWDRELKQFIL